MCMEGWNVVILIRIQLNIKESVIHTTVNLSKHRNVVCCAMLHNQHGLQAMPCCMYSLTFGLC